MKNDLAYLSLPPIKKASVSELPRKSIYIAALGFEDRALAWLNDAVQNGRRPGTFVLVEYLPQNRRNRVKSFRERIRALSMSKDEVKKLTYDRYSPDQFSAVLADMVSDFEKADRVIVDISGMSKLLIVALLTELSWLDCPLQIVYAEARSYYPNREEFEKSTVRAAGGAFLTRDVYKIATTERLTWIGLQNAPMLLIAFPTFNGRELDALCNELTPETVLIIEGLPRLAEDEWRMDAIRRLNQKLEDLNHTGRQVLSTFHYQETMEYLESAYNKYCDDYRIIIAPTGSKMQAVAVALFKLIHPDVQIVYPVTSGFSHDYTEGCKDIWSLDIPDWPVLVQNLRNHRMKEVMKLGVALRQLQRASA